MLTVRYCDPDGGEIVFPVSSVSKTPRKVGTSTSEYADVNFDRLPGSGPGLLQVSSGCVYVMNDHGKTVAKYDLGPYGDVPTMANAYSGFKAAHAQATGNPNVKFPDGSIPL